MPQLLNVPAFMPNSTAFWISICQHTNCISKTKEMAGPADQFCVLCLCLISHPIILRARQLDRRHRASHSTSIIIQLIVIIFILTAGQTEERVGCIRCQDGPGREPTTVSRYLISSSIPCNPGYNEQYYPCYINIINTTYKQLMGQRTGDFQVFFRALLLKIIRQLEKSMPTSFLA